MSNGARSLVHLQDSNDPRQTKAIIIHLCTLLAEEHNIIHVWALRTDKDANLGQFCPVLFGH